LIQFAAEPMEQKTANSGQFACSSIDYATLITSEGPFVATN